MIIQPDIALPPQLGIAISSRQGGSSSGPYRGNNLALHVGDDAQVVEANRAALLASLDGANAIAWLNQVHGLEVVAAEPGQLPNADASHSCEAGLACAVMTADCLPVLIWRLDGSAVAAAHAGWRGLAGGIISRALKSISAGPGDVGVYLGPAIGQRHFEVGVEVLEAFFESAQSAAQLEAISAASQPSLKQPLKYHLDLYQLARAELSEYGVTEIYGGDACSYSDTEHCYSHRRAQAEGLAATGRMASLIWRKA
ncbi:MAG: peptidoglycan editing factor PgeF [Cellvibrionaceae bacterium]|nr:peptidoglycan editing factor PgeF [Cellvibrionaceae bacterium]